jgi:hypothetical protein
MPYDYLTINEQDLTYGIVSASYFPTNLQSLYEQQVLNEQQFFGDNDDDIIEFSLYNSNQEPILFNRIVPKTTYSVVEGSYRDINNLPKKYSVKNPFTNYAINKNELLLHTQFDLKINELGPGLYYTLYNPVRNIAGNSEYRLFIKEISPSRTELRLSFAFNTNSNESSRLNAVKISSFADKKFVFLQLIDEIIPIIENNPIEQTFTQELNNNNINFVKYAQLLGLKSTTQLQEFISSTYIGYNKVINNSSDDVVLENIKFTGVSEQLKNFVYTYNQTEFSEQDILDTFKLIVAKVSQDAILQKTTLTTVDLTETLNVFIKIIYDDWLSIEVSKLLENYRIKYFDFYKNALNFDSGNLVKILTHTSYINPIDNSVNIQLKLDEPLPNQYSLKDTCWISNISLAPLYFKVNLYTAPVSRKVFLNSVNFSVETPTINVSNEKSTQLNAHTLYAAETRLKQKINDLLINYNSFNDFINFSSAELRTKIAKNKILKFESLNQQKFDIQTKVNSLSLGELGISISSSYATQYSNIINEQINLLDSFDEYESYLFYNTSSIDEKIENGIIFDQTNYNSLFYQLPEYIKTNDDYGDYIKFTAMVGHFFDNILVFVKKFPKSYPISYDDNNSYPKNYIEELLNSLSWDKTNIKFNRSGINQLLFDNTETTGSLSASYFDYAKSIFNRVTNNLNYIYKTKGSVRSFDLIRSIFGISSDLIDVKEYTTPSVLINRDVFYDYDDIIYATKFDSDQFIKFDFKNQDYKYLLTSQWTSGSTSLVGTTQVTQSYLEVFDGISTVEASFRIPDYDRYTYKDKIPLIKKLRNKSVDWQIYLYKTKQEQSAKLIFELTPKETLTTSSLTSIELPYLNGDFYTFMIRRQPDESITFDTLPIEVNKNAFTQSLTSSASEKYVPYIYTLNVNQYYGSQLNFTDKQSKSILYDQNQYFSSGSYYVGNFSASKQFVGNIDKIKVQKLPLSDADFEEHSYNLGSISTPNKEETYSNLYYLWSFDTPVNLYGTPYSIIDNQNNYYDNKFYAYNFNRNLIKRGSPYCDVISTDIFPYQFEKLSIKQATNSNLYGPNYLSNANIIKIDQQIDSNLVPYQYSSYTKDIVGSDSNLIGYYISPYNYLNSKIVDFLGKDGIADIIGDPKYLTSKYYPELKLKQKEFAKIYSKYIYPQEFYSTYKFYIDFSIFDFVKKLTPARATLKTGLLLEPSIFERVKFNYKDIEIQSFDGNDPANLLNYDISTKFTSSLIDTSNTSSFTIINNTNINIYKPDHNTYNYSPFEIKDCVDDRDFIYSKYGKYINIGKGGFNVRNSILKSENDYYQFVNDVGIITGSYNGYITTFTSSYQQLQLIGSGSGLINTQLTGSKILNNYYYGDLNSGYSKRHLSKLEKIGTRVRINAVNINKYSIVNGVKTLSSSSLNYYTYIKGQNTVDTTVNRKGLPNGSSPIISIPGFLSVDIESDNFPAYGTLTGSVQYPNSLFIQQPLTCSTCTSASLNNYIMNL